MKVICTTNMGIVNAGILKETDAGEANSSVSVSHSRDGANNMNCSHRFVYQTYPGIIRYQALFHRELNYSEA